MGMEMGMGTSMKRETASARTDEIRLPRSSGAKERSHVEQLRPPIANISISIRISICRQQNSQGKRGRHKFLDSVEVTESPAFAPHLSE